MYESNFTSSEACSYEDFDLRTSRFISGNLSSGQFRELQHHRSGSNAEILTAQLDGKKVALKMLKEKMITSNLAVQELALECKILSRLNHPNIVKIFGMGSTSQQFLVLEFLSGGTLYELLNPPRKNAGCSGFVSMLPLFGKKVPLLPLERVLYIAKGIASALRYLHEDCDKDAIIIHRGTESQQFKELSPLPFHLLIPAMPTLQTSSQTTSASRRECK